MTHHDAASAPGPGQKNSFEDHLHPLALSSYASTQLALAHSRCFYWFFNQFLKKFLIIFVWALCIHATVLFLPCCMFLLLQGRTRQIWGGWIQFFKTRDLLSKSLWKTEVMQWIHLKSSWRSDVITVARTSLPNQHSLSIMTVTNDFLITINTLFQNKDVIVQQMKIQFDYWRTISWTGVRVHWRILAATSSSGLFFFFFTLKRLTLTRMPHPAPARGRTQVGLLSVPQVFAVWDQLHPFQQAS